MNVLKYIRIRSNLLKKYFTENLIFVQRIRKDRGKFKSLEDSIHRKNSLKGNLSRWNIRLEQTLKSLKLEFYIYISIKT